MSSDTSPAESQATPPEAPNPEVDRDDEYSQAGSGFGNAETAEGGADAVPGTPDATPEIDA